MRDFLQNRRGRSPNLEALDVEGTPVQRAVPDVDQVTGRQVARGAIPTLARMIVFALSGLFSRDATAMLAAS